MRFVLASEMGVMLLVGFRRGLTVDLVGIESLLGGLLVLSLPDNSRVLTLLLKLEGSLALME